MTENKRFEVMDYFDTENKSIKAIRDNETTEIYSMDNELEANSTCGKLNALHEENEQLKKEKEDKQSHITHLENKIHRMRDNIKRLEGLYHYRGWEGTGDVKKECYQFKKEYTQLKKENKELKELVSEVDNELEIRDIVCGAGKFRLEEWGKHRYHQFYKGDEELEDESVVIMLMEFEKENKELKEILKHTYEIHECETCKHNENFNWLDPATMNREYDSKCGKGLYYDDEVHDCEEYELDLEMFKKRVKR